MHLQPQPTERFSEAVITDLACTDHDVVHSQDTLLLVYLYVEAIIIELHIGDTTQELDSATLQARTMNPARGLTQRGSML